MVRTHGRYRDLFKPKGLHKTKYQPETTGRHRWAEKWKEHQEQKQTKEKK